MKKFILSLFYIPFILMFMLFSCQNANTEKMMPEGGTSSEIVIENKTAFLIKLENIREEFDTQTGTTRYTFVIEYICDNCRHLVKESDIYCWKCGCKLLKSNLVEHYYKGKKITEKEYHKIEDLKE